MKPKRVSEFLTEDEISAILWVPDRRTLKGKGEKHHRVALNRDVMEAILDYQKTLGNAECRFRNVDFQGDNTPLSRGDGGQYLFYTLGEHGNCNVRPLTHKAVDCLLRRVKKDALITKRITPHTTRHTFATTLLARPSQFEG